MTAANENQRALVHLTFDDGPDPIWTPRILEALRIADARATFFVVTPAARRWPGLISAILHAGHDVEFHSADHIRHTTVPRARIEADTRTGLADLETLNVRPRLWRPPWGILAPWTAEIASEKGLEISLWTADTHDWRGDSATEMLNLVEDRIAPGTVVLAHDGIGPGALRPGCEETIALIAPLVERIRARNLEPEPLSRRHLPPREARAAASA